MAGVGSIIVMSIRIPARNASRSFTCQWSWAKKPSRDAPKRAVDPPGRSSMLRMNRDGVPASKAARLANWYWPMALGNDEKSKFRKSASRPALSWCSPIVMVEVLLNPKAL